MKIAMLLEEELRQDLFSQAAMDKLGQLGEVVCNETGKKDAETIGELLKGADIAISSWGTPQLTEELLRNAPELKLVAHAAGSVKGVVSDELYAKGIQVISSARVLSRGVSEMAMGLAIAAAKNVFTYNASIHAGNWPSDKKAVSELFDINVGVVGCGFAGAHFIELLQDYGVHVLAYDPGVSEEALQALGAKKVGLEEIFRQSDILSLHAPSIDATKHMVNEETLGWMKEDAILINTARGSLIDEDALYRCMKGGKLKYACLDVTDPEPPATDHPLFELPNCIFTPHVAGLANNGKRKIGVHVCQEIERFEKGEPLETQVTKEMLATIA